MDEEAEPDRGGPADVAAGRLLQAAVNTAALCWTVTDMQSQSAIRNMLWIFYR